MEHDVPRRLLLELVEQKGTTLAELSRAMGRNHAYLQQYLQRGTPRELPEDARAFLGQYFGIRPDLLRLRPRPEVAAEAAEAPNLALLPLDVPVHGTAVGGESGDFQLNGSVVDYVRRPPGVARANGVFALYVQGTSMEPWRFPGDPIYINPARPVRTGDHVLVEMWAAEDGEPGTAYVKRLVASTPTLIRLAQYNPPRDDIELPRDQVKSVLRIVEWSELLGL